MPAMSECNTATANGAVASSCNTDVSSDVPSSACFTNSLLQPAVETDSDDEWTYSSCSENAVVDQLSNKAGTQKSAANSDVLPWNDSIQ